MLTIFEIENGILKKYRGEGGDVIIPEGVTSVGNGVFSWCSSLTSITIPGSVTSIGNSAFSWCKSLKSVTIPEGVTSIGNDAFAHCSSLTSVTIPEGVTSIGNDAFAYCSSLTSMTIPESVTSIGEEAYRGCNGLADAEGFIIVRGVLHGYCGSQTSITIPEGVTRVGGRAFADCKSLKSVTIPEGVTSIGDDAFASCRSLTSITIPDSVTSIGDAVFFECGRLTSVTIPEGVTSIGRQTFSNCRSLTSVTIPDSVTSIDFEAFSGCINLRSVMIPEGVTSISRESFYNCRSLTRVILPKRLISIATAAFSGCRSLTNMMIPDCVTRIDGAAFYGCGRLTNVTIPSSVTSIGLNAFKDCENLSSVILPEGCDLDWLVNLNPKGDMGDGFHSCLKEIIRAADETEMASLIAKANKLPAKWKKLFFASYIYSDTRAAMLLADKRGELSSYASMRNVDEDELRDRMLSDLGLDEHHCKYYDLGNTTITVRLLPDFRFSLELPNGNAVKSLPKKGADPEKYTAAKTDFTQIKKDVVKIWKNRADTLLRDFLSGRERTAEYWKNSYNSNPILHAVACLLVWEQDGEYFIRTDGGTVHYDGTPYELTDKPIRLAHPMEMAGAEVSCWQQYFTSHCLKQPFEQIWEPVEFEDMVRVGRYDGCTVPLYALMNKEKHGIIMEGQKKLILRDCAAELEFIQGHHDWVNNEFEIKNFRFEKYTRQVNHIVTYLDRATVAGRIKKDDITAARWFDRFTLAQITDFIKLAQESNAVNVLAQLLEYKNAHFAYFDPMDEFTLE